MSAEAENLAPAPEEPGYLRARLEAAQASPEQWAQCLEHAAETDWTYEDRRIGTEIKTEADRRYHQFVRIDPRSRRLPYEVDRFRRATAQLASMPTQAGSFHELIALVEDAVLSGILPVDSPTYFAETAEKFDRHRAELGADRTKALTLFRMEVDQILGAYQTRSARTQAVDNAWALGLACTAVCNTLTARILFSFPWWLAIVCAVGSTICIGLAVNAVLGEPTDVKKVTAA